MCADLQSDANHCGACHSVCSVETEEACVAGVCRLNCESRTDGRKSECGGVCVDWQSDPNNCGQCGVQCSGTRCVNGQCEPFVCPTPEVACPPNNTCVDVQNHRFNCGKCGNSCGLNLVCEQGSCVSEEVPPSDGGEIKDDDRVPCDPKYGSVVQHCGPNEQWLCVNGQCIEAEPPNCAASGVPGLAECPPYEFRCVNLLINPTHCGNCGRNCEIWEECINGQCCSNGECR
jgi:hypothetical protein